MYVSTCHKVEYTACFYDNLDLCLCFQNKANGKVGDQFGHILVQVRVNKLMYMVMMYHPSTPLAIEGQCILWNYRPLLSLHPSELSINWFCSTLSTWWYAIAYKPPYQFSTMVCYSVPELKYSFWKKGFYLKRHKSDTNNTIEIVLCHVLFHYNMHAVTKFQGRFDFFMVFDHNLFKSPCVVGLSKEAIGQKRVSYPFWTH